MVHTKNENDLLFATEEVLRSGVSELTVTEFSKIPNSIQMRRLHLAMKLGLETNINKTPIGLILTPNKGGATSIESRWYASPLPCWKNLKTAPYESLEQKWSISRLFSRTDPLADWSLETVQLDKKDGSPKLLLLPIK